MAKRSPEHERGQGSDHAGPDPRRQGSLRARAGRASAVCLAAILLLGVVAALDFHRAVAQHEGPTPIEIRARGLSAFIARTPEQRRFGKLAFLGGLELSSPDRRFGGISGLVLLDRGERLVAVTDEGDWIEARLETDENGRPLGLSGARLSPILGENGEPLGPKRLSDAEALTLRSTSRGEELVLALEGQHRLLAFSLGGDLASARGRPIPVPADIGSLSSNKGIEALAAAPPGSPIAGALVALAERGKAGAATSPGWIVGGPRPGAVTVERRADHDITDAAFLPNGDLLLLERRFAWLDGVRMRLRRVPAAEIAPGATLQGEDLLVADLSAAIDNMEALAVSTGPDGRTLLTVLSDDNFSWFQRTLLLRFELLL